MPRTKSTDMAKASDRKQRFQPMDIKEYCDEILELYRNNRSTAYYRMRRIVTFLLERRDSSVKTTFDLTIATIEEFVGTIEHRTEKSRLDDLRAFRRACGLAVERGCLKRNPFDHYPLPKEVDRKFAGPRLDAVQVLSIMAYLKARKETWQGHRLYAFTATILLYGDLQTGDALHLKVAGTQTDRYPRLSVPVYDPKDGVIQVPCRSRRAKSLEPFPPRVELISRRLAEILAEWLPRRMKGNPNWAMPRFGIRRSDDGKSLIPDEGQMKVISEILLRRSEGWSFGRIARDLESCKIPTMRGRTKWDAGRISQILRRHDQTQADVTASAGEGFDSGWIFPGISGRAPWTKYSGEDPGYTPLSQLKDAGKALGIEGLTFESLRRFHRDHSRQVQDLDWYDRGDAAGESAAARQGGNRPGAVMLRDTIDQSPTGQIPSPRDSATIEDKSIDQAASISQTEAPAPVDRPQEASPWDDWNPSDCPGHIREDGHLIVFGRDKGPTSGSARKLFEAMEAKYPGGFTLNDFSKDQIVGDPRGILARYREKDLDCLAAIQLPKVRKGGLYRFGRSNKSTIVESTQNE